MLILSLCIVIQYLRTFYLFFTLCLIFYSDLSDVMHKVHETFIALAAQLHEFHEAVKVRHMSTDTGNGDHDSYALFPQ